MWSAENPSFCHISQVGWEGHKECGKWSSGFAMFAINTKGIVMNCKHCNERSIIFFL